MYLASSTTIILDKCIVALTSFNRITHLWSLDLDCKESLYAFAYIHPLCDVCRRLGRGSASGCVPATPVERPCPCPQRKISTSACPSPACTTCMAPQRQLWMSQVPSHTPFPPFPSPPLRQEQPKLSFVMFALQAAGVMRLCTTQADHVGCNPAIT